MKLEAIDVVRSLSSVVVPGLIFEEFKSGTPTLGALHSDAFPSSVSVYRSNGLYRMRADWELPNGLAIQGFTSVTSLLTFASEFLTPEALKGFKFTEVKQEPVKQPAITKTVITEVKGVMMEEVFFSDGSISVSYECKEKLGDEVVIIHRPHGQPLFNFVSGPEKLNAKWSSQLALFKHIQSNDQSDLI